MIRKESSNRNHFYVSQKNVLMFFILFFIIDFKTQLTEMILDLSVLVSLKCK